MPSIRIIEKPLFITLSSSVKNVTTKDTIKGLNKTGILFFTSKNIAGTVNDNSIGKNFKKSFGESISEKIVGQNVTIINIENTTAKNAKMAITLSNVDSLWTMTLTFCFSSIRFMFLPRFSSNSLVYYITLII